MNLISYSIKNYKSIKQGKFDATRTTVIIGRNNSGKSNIINSLKDFPSLYHIASTSRNEGMPGNWFESTVTGKDITKKIVYELEFKLSDREYADVLSEIKGSVEKANDRRAGRRAKTDMEEIQEKEWLSKFKIEISTGKHVPSGEVLRKLFFDGDYQKVKELQSSYSVFREQNPKQIRNVIIRDSLETWEFVDPIRRPKDVMPAGMETDLQSDGENLVKVLETLSANKPDLFDKISDSYVKVMEGVTDLRVEYDEDTKNDVDKTIMIEEGAYDTKFKSKEISSGSKEILSLLTQAYLSSQNTDILLIEEPELHLHPGAERQVFNILDEISEKSNTQIILSTHSEVFVNQVEVENIVRTERDGETTIRHISEDEIEDELLDLGYNQSRILQSEGVVFVEGRSDKRVLTEFCESKGLDLTEKGIEVVELEGEGNTKSDARSLVKVLFSFDIPYLFVVDSHDNDPDDEMQEYLEKVNRDDNGWWHTKPEHFHVWSGYGIESYLLDANAIASALGEPDAGTVQNLIDEAENDPDVDELDKKNVLEYVYQELLSSVRDSEDPYSKDRDGMIIARNMAEDELPEEVEEAVNEIESLPEKQPKEDS